MHELKLFVFKRFCRDAQTKYHRQYMCLTDSIHILQKEEWKGLKTEQHLEEKNKEISKVFFKIVWFSSSVQTRDQVLL